MEQINDIMHTLDVHIAIRKKQKRSGMCVTIKGIERNASKFCTDLIELIQVKLTYLYRHTHKHISSLCFSFVFQEKFN